MELVATILVFGAIIVYLLHSQKKERAELYQRIQAPEVAVQQAAKIERKPVPRVRYDNDDDFRDAREFVNGAG